MEAQLLANLPLRSSIATAALLLPVAMFATRGMASSSELRSSDEARSTADEPAITELAIAGLMLAPAWTHVGCIQLGSTCYDVFADNNGALWVCDECFTTRKPSRGKCRRLTNEEIGGAPWCA